MSSNPSTVSVTFYSSHEQHLQYSLAKFRWNSQFGNISELGQVDWTGRSARLDMAKTRRTRTTFHPMSSCYNSTLQSSCRSLDILITYRYTLILNNIKDDVVLAFYLRPCRCWCTGVRHRTPLQVSSFCALRPPFLSTLFLIRRFPPTPGSPCVVCLDVSCSNRQKEELGMTWMHAFSWGLHQFAKYTKYTSTLFLIRRSPINVLFVWTFHTKELEMASTCTLNWHLHQFACDKCNKKTKEV